MITAHVSQKFKFWSFASMFLLVFVHGYNLHERYLQPWTMPGESLTPTSFIEYFLANGIFRFRVPMLFVISGFLYALNDRVPYLQRIRKRLQTLLIPYLAWSAIALGFTYLLELSPGARNLLALSHIAQVDQSRFLLHDYRWYEVLARWIVFPLAYQLWFIRVLLIYNIAYPAIRWCVMHKIARWIFFGIVTLLWIATFGTVLFEGEGLLFFSLGVAIQKFGFPIDHPVKWLRPAKWGFTFLVLTVVKTIVAFKGVEIIGGATPYVLLVLHKLVVATGLIACWFGSDQLVRKCMTRSWFVWLSAFSFMIYALHAPMVAYAIDATLDWFRPIFAFRLAAFIALPLAVIGVCIATGSILRRMTPRLYGWLTGGRGLQ